jgi:hypothetical protein
MELRRIRAIIAAAEPTATTVMNESRRERLREKLARKVAALPQETKDAFVLLLQLIKTLLSPVLHRRLTRPVTRFSFWSEVRVRSVLRLL